ncbi:MAG: hypothetical protein VX644_13965, partial [Planctomycetota bacterium]|nr:hypothetical protein [Planctomycetota bacterium]
FLLHLTNEGDLQLDLQDEIVQGTLATHGGEVVHSRLRELLELPSLDPPVVEAEPEPVDSGESRQETGEESEDVGDEAADTDEQGES